MRIIVIEDNLDIAALLYEILTQEGHQVERCDGEGALDYNEWETVDVACVDLMMPGVTGIDILFFLKRLHPEVRRVVISAVTHLSHDVAAHADAVVDKPFTSQKLVEAVTG